MNLPNKLTLSRFGMTLVFFLLLYADFALANSMALVVFVTASLTDLLDGKIARSRGLITNFGALMDPLADKILTGAAFIAFVELQIMPAWMAVVIVSRELSITGLRMLAASKGYVMAAEGWGKHKTVSQMTAIIVVLLSLSASEWGGFGGFLMREVGGAPWIDTLARLLIWISVALTALSGGLYLWNNRDLYLKDA